MDPVMRARWAGARYPGLRVYLDMPDGATLQLQPVPGMAVRRPVEGAPGEYADVLVVFAFGPADLPTPAMALIRVEPDNPRVQVNVRVYRDAFGVSRFEAACPVSQTAN